MAIIEPPKDLVHIPDVPDNLLKLHDRLEQYNFDLVYTPKKDLFKIEEIISRFKSITSKGINR